MSYSLPKKLAAECFGTFCLVFAGTGAIIVNDISGGAVTHVGVALTFGLIVFAMIAAIGDISGAHLNPAVTFGFFLAKRFPGEAVAPYVISQFCGALLASITLLALFPTHGTLGSTIPAGAPFQSLMLEILLTAILMTVILSVTTMPKGKEATAGIAIGVVIALSALFAGPISGASMNPARSLAPALLSWHLDSLWVYLTGPLLGAALGVPLCRYSREPGCCPSPFIREKC
ncbi:MAG: aquaporin [Dethiobacter sp.]|nr:aquaporin [Dethiobacter sp.]MCL5982364.1 aquaporin [Bacillota bacterium]